MRCNVFAAAVVVTVMGLVTGSGASAALLMPGTTESGAETPSNPQDGSLIDSLVEEPFSAATFSGNVTQEVWQEDTAANPLGGLTFIYQVTSDAGSLTEIERLSVFDYAGFTVNATYFGPGTAPLSFDRNAAGSVVGTNLPSLAAGDQSAWLVLRTDAPEYTEGVIAVINGGAAQLVGFAPIPEPASLALLGVGGLLLFRRRRQ